MQPSELEELSTHSLSRDVAEKVRGVVVAGYLSAAEKNAVLERALQCAGREEGVPAKVRFISTEALASVLNLALQVVSTQTLNQISDLLKLALGPTGERRQALITECNICVFDVAKVRLTLPATMSRVEFLTQVQGIAREVYGQDAVFPLRLDQWSQEEEFTARPANNAVIAIDGILDRSSYKTRDEQVEFLDIRGLEMPELRDLAVAHAAYFLATGKDLFDGAVVRARGGALGFGCLWDGLYVSAYTDEERLGHIAASAYLRFGYPFPDLLPFG